MTIVQDLYSIYDREHAKYLARRSSQHQLLIEMRNNLAFVREGLGDGLATRAIARRLEDARFQAACSQGFDLDRLQKKRLAAATCAGIREFDRYRDWPTSRLVETVYQRIDTLRRLSADGSGPDLTVRLQNLFKLLMLVLAHIEGRLLRATVRR